MTFSSASSGVSIEGPKVGLAAALHTTMSIWPQRGERRIDQRLQFLLAAHVAGHGKGGAAGGVDRSGGRLAGIGLAAGDHHLGTVGAICSAIDLPMPRLEPVMRATLPERSNRDMALPFPIRRALCRGIRSPR